MSVKLIAADLDGTLLAPDHMTITERTKEVLSKAHEKGMKFAISTGRTLSFVDSVTKQLPFVDYIIYSNGASVYDVAQKKVIYENHISPEQTKEAIAFLVDYPVYYHLYMNGRILVQNGLDKYFDNPGLPKEFLADLVSRFEHCDDLGVASAGMGAEVIDLFATGGEIPNEVIDYFGGGKFALTSAVRGEVAITALGADKGAALSGICVQAGILLKEVMTFGDAANDCPMLEIAGYSFAMENGSEECKRSAWKVAPPNSQDGVAQMIEKYAF